MASTVVLKRRIASIKSTRQITKALQLVAASKMRRAQDYANRSRAYGELATSLMIKLSSINELDNYDLFKVRKITNRLYIVITSNSGLAGAYNSNVLRSLLKIVAQDQKENKKSFVIAIGNKAAHLARNLNQINLLAVYNSFADQPSANDIRPILNSLINHFKENKVDEVVLIYTKFKSNISQEVSQSILLPVKMIVADSIDRSQTFSNFEPDVETVIDEITTRLIEAQLWQALLESIASEHSMRMLAMKNATDNAKDLIDDYTLELNTARQASITQELAEITGGVEALNG